MSDTVITHLSDTEERLLERPAAPGTTVDVLERSPVRDPLIFPVVETWFTGHANGYLGDPQPTPLNRVWHRAPWGCFHDLWSADDNDLNCMGGAIIGDVCKTVATKQLSTQADAKLVLKLARAGAEIPLPWPGMPDDRPVPLDLTELPFSYEMFLGDDQRFTKRLHRLQLAQRIADLWVPHVRGLLKVRV